jgi:hypothetical protein
MAERKTYTDAEKAEYWKKRAQGGKAKRGTSRKRSATRTTSRKRKTGNGKYKKRSGCKMEDSYIAGPNSKFGKPGERVERPHIFGWRRSKQHGFQTFSAFLGKNNGEPQNGTSSEICRVFVVNITTQGVGTQRVRGVWSVKYNKLTIGDGIDLVANPNAKNGGYFGRGGKRYRDKVK